MAKRVPAPMRTRQSLSDLIECGLSSPAGREELVKLATGLIVEEALVADSRDVLGRAYYELGASSGQDWGNGKPHRSAEDRGRVLGLRGGADREARGAVPLGDPREPEGTHPSARGLGGGTLGARYIGVRLRGCLQGRDGTGRLLLSRTAVSEIGERLWRDYQDFATRDLSEYDIAYLFVDGIAERIRPGQRREPVLAAWGFTSGGAEVLLHLMAGSKEDAETASAFFQHMRPAVSGTPCWWSRTVHPASSRRSRTASRAWLVSAASAHRMRNLAAKVPEDVWFELKARGTACYQGLSRAIARDLADGVVADFETELPSAVACFLDDFEACIAHLRMPIGHCRAIRTTNLLERLFVEERRRLKTIPNAFGAKPFSSSCSAP